MNVLATMGLRGLSKTIYADDIAISGKSISRKKKGLRKFTNLCNSLGLIISPEKNKTLAKARLPKETIRIQGKKIEYICDIIQVHGCHYLTHRI